MALPASKPPIVVNPCALLREATETILAVGLTIFMGFFVLRGINPPVEFVAVWAAAIGFYFRGHSVTVSTAPVSSQEST